MLVAAVFAPERAKHAQLNRVWLPVQALQYQVVLGSRKRNLVQCFLGHRHLTQTFAQTRNRYVGKLLIYLPFTDDVYTGHAVSSIAYSDSGSSS